LIGDVEASYSTTLAEDEDLLRLYLCEEEQKEGEQKRDSCEETSSSHGSESSTLSFNSRLAIQYRMKEKRILASVAKILL
jgi:hypothetical protein